MSKIKENELINIKQFAYVLTYNWFWFMLSILLCLFFAFITNRYTPHEFSTKTTLLVQSDNNTKNPIAQILYGEDQFSMQNSLNDEILILQSYPLIYNTVTALGYEVQYLIQGDIKTVETYEWRPIDFVSKGDEKGYGLEIVIEIINDQEFILTSNQMEGGKFFFNEELDFRNSKFSIRLNEKFNFHEGYENAPTIMVRWKNPHNVAKKYKNKLIVEKIKLDASIIQVGLIGEDVSKETTFLNKLTALYIQKNLNDKNRASSNTIDFIDNQLRETRDSLAFIENKLQGFKKDNSVTSISVDAERFYDEISVLEKEKATVLIQQKYYDYLIEYLSSKENYEEVVVPVSYGISDNLLNNMISKLVELQIELNILDPKGVLENPVIRETQRQIHELRESVKESVKNQKKTNEILLNDINSRVSLSEKALGSLPQMERELVNIERLYRLSENIYLFLMQKRAEAGITGASNVSDVKVVEAAIRETSVMVAPNRRVNYLVGLILGLLLPLIVFALQEILNDKINSKSDIERLSKIPFLGVIGKNHSGHDLIVKHRPKSSIAEGFRSIRSNLEFLFEKSKEGKAIVFTSSISGEGKTFCAKNLATIYAMSGKKTILIGADMRKPKLYVDFDKENKKGLSTYLIGEEKLKDVIKKSEIENLSVITSGPVPPNPAELLGRDNMQLLITELKEQFDYVILDSPPVGLVSDPVTIMELVDISIYVVRQGYTHQSFLNYVNEFYDSGKLNNITILLNEAKIGGVYGYGYGYGYGEQTGHGYYEEDVIEEGFSVKNIFKKS